jgi:predicted GIY-YIG superfamily endonuclease
MTSEAAMSAICPEPDPSRPHDVYRIYDAQDNLLYVGISCDFEARFRNHKSRAEWAPDYDHHTLTPYPTRWEAESAEQASIMTEHPRHNVAGVIRPPRPEKPVRITIDLSSEDHLALRKYIASAGVGGSAAKVVRALLSELRDDPELASRVRARIWNR